MDYIGEIISGVFALLVVWLEVRMTRDRKQAEKRAIIRAKESKLAMKMQDASLLLLYLQKLSYLYRPSDLHLALNHAQQH